MLTVLADLADAYSWLDHNAYVAAWLLLAVGVAVLVARALPRHDRAEPPAEPEAADFDAHPDAAELDALFAGALAEYGVAETSDDN